MSFCGSVVICPYLINESMNKEMERISLAKYSSKVNESYHYLVRRSSIETISITDTRCVHFSLSDIESWLYHSSCHCSIEPSAAFVSIFDCFTAIQGTAFMDLFEGFFLCLFLIIKEINLLIMLWHKTKREKVDRVTRDSLRVLKCWQQYLEVEGATEIRKSKAMIENKTRGR